MLVVIDSTEVYEDWNLSRLRTRRLPMLQKSGHTLGMPSIVFDEHWGQVARVLGEWWTSVGTEIAPLFGIDLPKLESGELDQRLMEAKAANLQLLLDSGVEILPYPSVNHQEVLARCIARRKPFDQDGRGYGDALIWYTIFELFKTRSEPLAFLSNNVRDFMTKDGLHAELAGDLAELETATTRLVVFRDFYQFHSQEIKPVLQMLRDVEREIREKKFPLDLERWLSTEGVQLFSSRKLTRSEFGGVGDQAYGLVTRIPRVISVTPTDVRALSDDEVVVYATAQIEASVRWPVASNQAFAYLADPTALAVAEATGELEIEFLVWAARLNGHVAGSELGTVRPGAKPPGSFTPTITQFASTNLVARASMRAEGDQSPP